MRIGLGLLLASLALAAGCRSSAEKVQPTAPPLRTLDARTAADFRAAFDEAKDRARYVVSLSPT